ncbi:MAG: hypothetical protein BWK80_19030 [Desulfobacteraceae bacterium IS3]|nr:MAG: hypothetical protein BWK80_19030 [Desulfobacteraceae bacterium IS3]
MLERYEIANFKAFGGPEIIPIKPITLIFGPNSSGKSSIIQSLLMVKQTLDESRSSNVALLPQGFMVNLGNFREFIHRHEEQREFSFKMTFPSPINIEDIFDRETLEFDLKDSITNLLKDLLNYNESFGLKIFFSATNSVIKVKKFELFIGKNPVGTYEIVYDNMESFEYKFRGIFEHNYWKHYWEILHKNDHAKFIERATGINDEERLDAVFKRQIAGEVLKKLEKLATEEVRRNANLIERIHKLKGFDQAIETYKEIVFKYDSPIILRNFLPQYQPFMKKDEDALILLITQCVAGLIRNFFENVIYIAPLRNKPERYYIYGGQNPKDVGYAGEMTADVLFANSEILNAVNKQFDKLGIGYEIQIPRLYDENQTQIKDVFALQLKHKQTGVVITSLNDVGFGISQIFPIVVQSMFSKEKALIIEQPELHLHPKLQAELGDMFINSALGAQKNNFIIETHSEHLILRILRRIRETADEELPEEIMPITPEDIAVLYVQSGEKGSKVIHIPVTKNGRFNIPWPEGFFAERAKEL